MKTINKPVALAASLLAGLAIASVTPAKADLTITGQVNVSGLPTPGGPGGGPGGPGGAPGGPGGPAGGPPRVQYPETVTTYIKGDYVRTEVKGGEVRIYNGERQRIYHLNPTDKTYWTEDAGDNNGGFGGGRFQIKVDSNLNIKPADTTKAENATQVAGAKAQKYLLSGTVTMSFERNDDNGGGQPAQPQGGNGGNGGRRRGGFGMGPITMSGEVWASNSITLPTDDKFLLAAFSEQLAPGGRQARMLVQPLVDQIENLKAIPLKSKISVTIQRQNNPITITATYAATSVSTAALDDSLFRAPDDYEHVDPPQRGFGGGGFGGGGGGRRRGGGGFGGGGGAQPQVQ